MSNWKEIFKIADAMKKSPSLATFKAFIRRTNPFTRYAVYLLCAHHKGCQKTPRQCPLLTASTRHCEYSLKVAGAFLQVSTKKVKKEDGEWRVIRIEENDVVPTGEQLQPMVAELIIKWGHKEEVANKIRRSELVLYFLNNLTRYVSVACKQFQKPQYCKHFGGACLFSDAGACYRSLIEPVVELLEMIQFENKT